MKKDFLIKETLNIYEHSEFEPSKTPNSFKFLEHFKVNPGIHTEELKIFNG